MSLTKSLHFDTIKKKWNKKWTKEQQAEVVVLLEKQNTNKKF